LQAGHPCPAVIVVEAEAPDIRNSPQSWWVKSRTAPAIDDPAVPTMTAGTEGG
jgi:hypothetical protein